MKIHNALKNRQLQMVQSTTPLGHVNKEVGRLPNGLWCQRKTKCFICSVVFLENNQHKCDNYLIFFLKTILIILSTFMIMSIAMQSYICNLCMPFCKIFIWEILFVSLTGTHPPTHHHITTWTVYPLPSCYDLTLQPEVLVG